jgi:hypothetical protein
LEGFEFWGLCRVYRNDMRVLIICEFLGFKIGLELNERLHGIGLYHENFPGDGEMRKKKIFIAGLEFSLRVLSD